MLRREELIWPNGIGVDYLLDRLVRQALIELNRHN
jgi:UDP-N-acetyl-D-mannosaminuronic acid transferase (WecB/TagA/CpsF family)